MGWGDLLTSAAKPSVNATMTTGAMKTSPYVVPFRTAGKPGRKRGIRRILGRLSARDQLGQTFPS